MDESYGKRQRIKTNAGTLQDYEKSTLFQIPGSNGEIAVGASVTVKFSYRYNSVDVTLWRSTSVPEKMAEAAQGLLYKQVKDSVYSAAIDALKELKRVVDEGGEL